MAAWTPADYIELVKAVFYGVGAICIPLATVYVMVSAARLQKLGAKVADVGIKIDGMLVQRDAANVAAGERKGVQASAVMAAVLAEGQKQGREIAREQQLRNGDQPLPVADDRTAVAAERSATATERVADAAEDNSSSPSKKT